jgi:hypothetical protein
LRKNRGAERIVEEGGMRTGFLVDAPIDQRGLISRAAAGRRSCVSSRSRKRHTPISHDCECPLDCSIALRPCLEYGVASADLKPSIPWARSRFLERKRLR